MSTLVDYVAEGPVARIRLQSPSTLNALSPALAQQFLTAVTRATDDPAIRIIALGAEGRAFMAGGDLNHFHDAADKRAAADALIGVVNQALIRLRQTDKIVVSAVQGAVAGGGIGIALCADLVIAADDAAFTTAYARIGATLDCGGSAALLDRVGYAKALEMALLSEPVPAADALRLGLVNRVVPRADLEEASGALIRTLANGAPLAQHSVKALLRAGMARPYEDQLAAERATFGDCAASDDFAEGVAAFLGKRRPVFHGR